ncbi:MAG: D-alanyl-D-alanine endopeptidase [Gallionellaceae bacterium]|nr:D-alanyl-D-alanine endopeptidase [Gallionellaceae bacterium]
MRIKLIILALLLGQGLSVQAEPNDEVLYLQRDEQLTNTVFKYTSAPKLRSSIALIYDEQDQRPLYSKNANAIVPIASITKLMTAMIILDAQLPLEEEIRIGVEDLDTLKGTRSRIRLGMVLTRGELLKLALMASENRAAAALARTFPGGGEIAVEKMNSKARELGMQDTYFRDATGLNSGNVSTAKDLVKMMMAAQRYQTIRQYTTSSSHLVALTGRRSLRFSNTNPLVKSAAWDIGISKTGYISEAGRCLVMAAKITQRPVIIVLLDSSGKRTRVGDANRIKKWIENAYARSARNTKRG